MRRERSEAASPIPSASRPRAVVLGCGFTGAAAVVALAAAAKAPLEIVVVEPASALGGGLAYGRAAPWHLLNIRAEDLTIRADRPGDFADWAVKDEGSSNRSAAGQRFFPRSRFGRYAEQRLREAVAQAPLVRLTAVGDLAETVSRSAPHQARGLTVTLQRGGRVEADAVILATGYGSSFQDRGLGQDPYGPLDRERLGSAGRVVCIGSGLTMVDAVISLREAGFHGEVVALSRHGLLPEPHAREAVPVYPWRIVFEPTSLAMARAVRRACRDAEARGLPWQSVVNALRPHAARVWTGLDEEEQARFLRHLFPYWSVRRHRLPPEVFDQIRNERTAGGLVVRRGHALGLERRGAGVDVVLRTAGGGVERLPAQVVLDCSGFRPDIGPHDLGLVSGGLARRDSHGLGLAVAADGGLLDHAGAPQRDLFALGPLGQGSLLEVTAAPEIVRQAALCAETLLARVGKKQRIS
jgi:uncharacterized NAD(P)/FAD-binding protein YdhS